MNEKHGLSRSFVETIAGFTAGIVSTLSVHPLDIVKTRLQGTVPPPSTNLTRMLILTSLSVDRVSSSRIGSSLRVVRDIARNEGGIQAFYRGLTPNLVGNSVSWALYFFWYSNVKDILARSHKSGREGLGSADYFIASGAAGEIYDLLSALYFYEVSV